MKPDQSRYYQAVQRSKKRRKGPTNFTRTAVVGALIMVPVACGNNDQSVFGAADATTTTSAEAATSTTSTGAEIDTAITSSTGSSDVSSNDVASTQAPETGAMFPTGAEMEVSFTYQASEANRAKRPYIAVWVEDIDGNLVDTISIWYKSGKGDRWLNDLHQWYDASGGDTSMSGATREPGTYTVAWDGTDYNGDPVAAGDYVLNIESAREDGPTSFTSGTISIGDQGFTVALDDSGELSAAAATLSL